MSNIRDTKFEKTVANVIQGPVVINVTKYFVAKNATKLENVTNLGKLHLNVM